MIPGLRDAEGAPAGRLRGIPTNWLESNQGLGCMIDVAHSWAVAMPGNIVFICI